MGWGSGSRVATDIIQSPSIQALDAATRKAIFIDVIEALEGSDWDTHMDCLEIDPAFDEALEELHPSWFDEDEW